MRNEKIDLGLALDFGRRCAAGRLCNPHRFTAHCNYTTHADPDTTSPHANQHPATHGLTPPTNPHTYAGNH